MIELADAPESGIKRYLRHWHIGLLDEILSEVKSMRARDFSGRDAQVLDEQAAQLS
jgi:hypothetical protein